jgi:hypothetical protein
MAKKIYEERAKDRFVKYRNHEREEQWEVASEDYVTDPRTGRNFDYQLSCGSKRIALEIMRVVDDQRLREFIVRSEINSMLGDELKKLLPGDRDIIVWTPAIFRIPKARWGQFVRKVATELESVTRSWTQQGKAYIDRYPFTANPSPGSGLIFSECCRGYSGGFDLCGQSLTKLRQKLPHKNRQLSVEGHERIVLIVCLEGTILPETIQEAILQIDFSSLPNIDGVYCESGLGPIHLVYDRAGGTCLNR